MDSHAPRDTPLPVLMVSGFMPFPAPPYAVRNRFRRHGYQTEIVPFRVADMRDVDTYAGHVVAAADALCKAKHSVRLHLVGYSMGGVACLFALKRFGLADRVETFVSLGAPFRGSRFSRLGSASALFSRTGRQLSPDSPYLDALREGPLPDGPRYLSIAGNTDAICPPPTALLDGATHRIVPAGHLRLLFNPRIADLVARFLR